MSSSSSCSSTGGLYVDQCEDNTATDDKPILGDSTSKLRSIFSISLPRKSKRSLGSGGTHATELEDSEMELSIGSQSSKTTQRRARKTTPIARAPWRERYNPFSRKHKHKKSEDWFVRHVEDSDVSLTLQSSSSLEMIFFDKESHGFQRVKASLPV